MKNIDTRNRNELTKENAICKIVPSKHPINVVLYTRENKIIIIIISNCLFIFILTKQNDKFVKFCVLNEQLNILLSESTNTIKFID